MSDDSNHNLSIPKCSLWKEGSYDSLFLSLSLEVEDDSPKVMETITPKGVFIGFPLLGLSDLSSTRLRLLNLA